MNTDLQTPLFELALSLGDDHLILGHRLSEWCGHAPILEEDIALANIALDCLGHAANFLTLAGEIEGKGRDGDALAYFRDVTHFRNLLLVERPRGDFALTIARQFLFDAFALPYFSALSTSPHEALSGIAQKAVKEIRYHLRHSSEWVIRLGDGTEESHDRITKAVGELWCYTGEMFETPPWYPPLIEAGIAPSPASFKPEWERVVHEVFTEATLAVPESNFMHTGGRTGKHSEHLGHLLTEMQSVARAHPGATW